MGSTAKRTLLGGCSRGAKDGAKQYQSSVHSRSLPYVKGVAFGKDNSLWSPLGAEVSIVSSMSRNCG